MPQTTSVGHKMLTTGLIGAVVGSHQVWKWNYVGSGDQSGGDFAIRFTSIGIAHDGHILPGAEDKLGVAIALAL